MFKNPFSFYGRIRRTEFGISFLIFYISSNVITYFMYSNNNKGIALAFIPLLWFLFAQGAKREHDINFSGWWQLIPFRHIWLIFLKGNIGSNRFGNDPKER